VNINRDKLQTISNSILSTITTNNATSTGEVSIPAIIDNNSTAAATAILPITSMMTNLGIPLTGSTAIGFVIGIMRVERDMMHG